ncbi:MAG TPA: 3-dehydroquinate synthase [Phycisphaerae bacterium]|nr:3-dehydroquinate synthase [Phycisphaerae bacterium]
MPTVRIKLESTAAPRYDIQIGDGLLAKLGSLVKSVAPAASCGVITDQNVAKFYLAAAEDSLQHAGFRTIFHIIPAGEENKNLLTVSAALDAFLNARLERSSPIIALGGGVVGDSAGLVAAVMLRGVPLIQVPTSLLAMVDSSVGGKVGVDHAMGKNLIGAFHQPRLVVTDVIALRTLPDVELRCGLAECIKHGIIKSRDLFDFITVNLEKIKQHDPAVLSELVARNVRIKAAIVMEDPFENGPRALLNLGHTFGHALETVAVYTGLRHGEAVALGMIAAGRLAQTRKLITKDDVEKIQSLIVAVDLPVHLPSLDIDAAFTAMHSDKKVRDGRLRFILPTTIGEAQIVSGVPETQIRDALKFLIQ